MDENDEDDEAVEDQLVVAEVPDEEGPRVTNQLKNYAYTIHIVGSCKMCVDSQGR